MSRKILRSFLLGLVAMLLLTTLMQSEGVIANYPLPEQQVLGTGPGAGWFYRMGDF